MMVEIITIDGPASSGKSTLAKKISTYYKSPLLHSGLLYRKIAAEIISKKIQISKKELIKIAKSISIKKIEEGDLFSSEVDNISSKISAKKYIRNILKEIQLEFPRKYAKGKKYAIIEGRDIGTEIFPDAKHKIFIWADAKIRAQRRFDQIAKKRQKSSLRRVYREIITRDLKDLNRRIAPLRPAANSVLLDTSYLDIEQAFNVINKILNT